MIHMGAAMGKLLSQGVTSSRFPNMILIKRFRNMYGSTAHPAGTDRNG